MQSSSARRGIRYFLLAGLLGLANHASASILPAPTLTGAPYQDDGVSLSWTAVSGATRYRVTQRRNDDEWDTIYHGTGTSSGASNLRSGFYEYRVRACATTSVSTCGYWSNYYEITITAPTPPATPSGLSGPSTATGQFTLSWSSVPTATSYRLRHVRPDSSVRTIHVTPTSYTVFPIPQDHGANEFSVAACNQAGCSQYSSPAKTVQITYFQPIANSVEGPAMPNSSLTVGRTLGSSQVTPTGEATYSIPIFAPPGVNGMTPEMALSYNHSLPESLAGVGWSVSGLSAIRRCAATVAQNGGARGVKLTKDDRYCLDGNQLRLTSGTYGNAGSTYRTERDTVAKIVAGSNTVGGPASFTVYQKDGLIYEYGSTGDSRIESIASGFQLTPHTWALSEIRDRSGNQIKFVYEEEGAPTGAFRPLEVQYRVNDTQGQSAGYAIRFVYETQPATDVDSGYFAGGKIRDTKRIDRIDVMYLVPNPDTVVRRYELTYSSVLSRANRSLLSRVEECDGSGACREWLSFSYQNGTLGLGSEVAPGVPSFAKVRVLALDINGDGIDDLAYPSALSSGTWRYRLGSSSGSYGGEVNTNLSSDGYDFEYAQAMNYDGNRFDDLLVPYNGNWWILRGSATGFQAAVNTGTALDPNIHNERVAVFDRDHDGYDDLMWSTEWEPTQEEGGPYYELHAKRNLSGSGFAAQATTFFDDALDTQTTDPFSMMSTGNYWFDANGDGVQDFAFVSEHMTHFDEISTEISGSFQTIVYNNLSNTRGLMSADVNGDGYSDLVYRASGALRVQFSNGINFQPPIAGPSYNGYGSFVVTDWDGDGMEELIARHTSTARWHVFRSNGENLTTPQDTGLAASSGSNVVALDANGDGLIDIGYKNSSYTFVVRLRSGPKADLLKNVTDGYFNQTNFIYDRITAGSYTPGSSSPSFPDIDYIAPVYVVSQVRRNTGLISSVYTVDYSYEDLRRNVEGRQLLGFKARTMTDSRTGIETREEYRQDFPYTGLLKSRAVRQADNTLIRYETYAWSKQTGGSGFESYHLPWMNGSLVQNFEVGGPYNGVLKNSITGTFVADNYGTVTDMTVVTREGTGANGISPGATYTERTLLSSVSNNTANWCIGLPGQTQLINSHNQAFGATITRTVSHSWDTTRCRLDSEIIEPGSAQYRVDRSLGYDAYGNIDTETVTGVGMVARTTTTNWGVNKNLPISTTNALGHTTSYVWDYATGDNTRVTDPNGIVTQIAYNGFGEPERIDRPDGTYVEMLSSPCSLPNSYCGTGFNRVVSMLRLNYRASNGSIIRYEDEFFDRFDRPVQRHTPTMTGAVSRVRTHYDIHGNVHQVSMPTLSSVPIATHYQTITYDILNRPTSVSQPISSTNGTLKTQSTFYEGLTTRIVDYENETSWLVSNAFGETVRTRDTGGYHQDFSFDAFGSLRRVRDSLGVNHLQKSYAYGLGVYETMSSDLSFGSWTYTPNALGEVTAYSDAKGQSFTATFDKLSRQLTRVEPDGTTTWVWGTSAAANNIGSLASVSSPGYSESYGYDSAGRLDSRTTTTDTAYQTNWDYAATTGLLESITYPVSTAGQRLKVRYHYQNGYARRVSDFDNPVTIFYQANQTDAWGNIIDESLGNGLRTVRGYDPVAGHLDYITTGPAGGSASQNLDYQWNRIGSLTEREDLNRALEERFFYDAMHRLDYSTLNGATNVDLSYDAMGNITYKSDVGSGTWTYHSSKRQSVTNAAGTVYSYDANGNMISRGGEPVTWTSFNKPKRINLPGADYHEFWYGPDRQRYRHVNTVAGEDTYLVGNLLEKRTAAGVTEYRHHISMNGRVVAIHSRPTSGSTTTRFPLYDHAGSVDAFTNPDGSTYVASSFAAFGERRDAADWSGPPPSGDESKIRDVTPRGFTYHTNLDGDSLIHMGGRVMDGHIGRFLSPDPLVPAPNFTQSYNRYSYVFNNPLSLTDPSGFDPIKITISLGMTLGGFAEGLFGNKSRRPSGCFSAPVACYGQAGVTRVPGFGGTITVNWANQPVWTEQPMLSINGRTPDYSDPPAPRWRDRLFRLGKAVADFVILDTIESVKETYYHIQDGNYAQALLSGLEVTCDVAKVCKIVTRIGGRVVSVTRNMAKRNYPNRAVRPGDEGTYGDLRAQRRAHGQTEPLHMDHQPSLAAQVRARENALGRPLTKSEINQVRNNTPAVASPRAVHQETSPTYGGRNTPAQIAGDAADLDAARVRDRGIFDEALRNR